MSYYRKLHSSIWNEQPFSDLSDDGKLVFFFLLTHPHMTALGAMRATLPGIACELNWPVDRLEMALSEKALCDQVVWDQAKPLVWLRNFLKDNLPESPNVVKSWEGALAYLPDSVLKEQLMAETTALVLGLSEGFREALPTQFQAYVHSVQPLTGASESSPCQKACPKPSSKPSDKALSKTSLNTNTKYLMPNNKEVIPKAKEVIPKTKEETEEIVLLANSEEKKEIGEINNIVAPTRQKTARPPDAEVVEVFRCWQRTLGHPQAQLDAKRRKIIRRALSSGYNFAQLSEAIKGCAQTPHNMGENEQGQRYDGLHIIFRDADQIDRFIHNAHSPPRRRTAADQLFADNLAASDRWLAKKQQQAEKEIHAIN